MKRQKYFYDKLSWILSGVFSPPVVAALAVGAIAWYYSDTYIDAMRWSMIGIGLIIVPPCIYIIIAHRLGKISAVDLNEREERLQPVALSLLGAILGMFFLSRYDNVPLGIRIVSYTLLAEMGLIMFVTLYWKISIHMMTLAAAITLLVFLYSWWAVLLYLWLPPVAWSRIHRKRHTLAQTIVGSMAGIAMVLGVLGIFWNK